MKRITALFLIIFTVVTALNASALVPTETDPSGAEGIWFEANVHDGYYSYFDYEYLESIGVTDSRYGTGCFPYLIESWEEYDKIFPCSCEPDCECGCRKVLIPEYFECDCEPVRDESFYDTHVTVIIYASAPTLSHVYTVDSVEIGSIGEPIINYTCVRPSGGAPDAVQLDVIAVTLKRADFTSIIDADFVPTIIYSGGIEFEPFVFDAYFGDAFYDKYGWSDVVYGRRMTPQLVTSAEQLEAVIGEMAESKELNKFAQGLTDNYFDEHALIIQFTAAPSGPTDYVVTHVTVNGGELCLGYCYNKNGTQDAIEEHVIVVEVAKSDVEDVVYLYPGFEASIDKVADVDGNGYVEPYDYIYAKRHYFGTLTLTDKMLSRADVNYDGMVNQYDYILIRRVYFGTYSL
ncbi:MAG: dockerin type I repeat-containing protein [Clostridia bacterium]|nr:dockerin type I repeat-containing protein [Clostridia bacterium]